jgi:hypothetical protein
MLRDCHFANIGTMLLAIVLHVLGNVENVAVVDPAALTIEQARAIGRGFGAMVLGNSMPEAAVDEFFLTYPSMRTMDHEYMWFRPMIEVIATRRMESAPFGLKMRVAVGAALSFGDVISDLMMILNFLSAGSNRAAYGTLAMVAFSLLLQIVVSIAQTKHRGWIAVAYEVMIVLCFLKPAVDAYRVASGRKHARGSPLSPITELHFVKGIELIFEAIPALMLQSAIVMVVGDPSMLAVASIVFSCLAVAYTSTTMAYDFETDPLRRKNNPEFYG